MKRDDHMRKFEWKKKNRQQSHMCGNKGYTLVELIVTFALLAIFMTAVVACLPNITKIYTNLQAINHQKTICNTVSNQIRNELQSTLGVEGADDALGVQNVNGKGYIALIDDSGQQIMIPTGGAVSTGGAILPASDLTGDTIEFVLRDGIIAQLDAKGFNGYTMRKKKLQVDYHDAKAISSGALLTRYYQTDGDYNKKLTVIDYKSGDYAVATEAGIVTEGLKNVAYAIEYPYAKPFYEGYELKTKFTIKKDAFYTYGDGTTESPARTYVNYINYTLSLWKDGHMKYSQDYVVNVQNAVPYLGTKVASDPVVPDVPGYTAKDTYVDPEIGVNRVPDHWWKSRGHYTFMFHIASSLNKDYSPDHWTIRMPDGIRLISAYWVGDDGEFSVSANTEEKCIDVHVKDSANVGYIDETWMPIRMEVETYDGQELNDDILNTMIGTGSLSIQEKWPAAIKDDNAAIEVVRNDQYDGLILKFTAKQDRVKQYVEVTYDEGVEIESFDESAFTYCHSMKAGNKAYVYGRSVGAYLSGELKIKAYFKDGLYHKPVKVVCGGDKEIPLD